MDKQSAQSLMNEKKYKLFMPYTEARNGIVNLSIRRVTSAFSVG